MSVKKKKVEKDLKVKNNKYGHQFGVGIKSILALKKGDLLYEDKDSLFFDCPVCKQNAIYYKGLSEEKLKQVCCICSNLENRRLYPLGRKWHERFNRSAENDRNWYGRVMAQREHPTIAIKRPTINSGSGVSGCTLPSQKSSIVGQARDIPLPMGKGYTAHKIKGVEILKGKRRVKIWGWSITSIMRWMGGDAWTLKQVKTVLEKLGLRNADTTIKIQMDAGRTRKSMFGPPAKLKKSQIEVLYSLLNSKGSKK